MVFVFVHPRLKWSKRRPLATSWSLDLPCETIAPRIGQAPPSQWQPAGGGTLQGAVCGQITA